MPLAKFGEQVGHPQVSVDQRIDRWLWCCWASQRIWSGRKRGVVRSARPHWPFVCSLATAFARAMVLRSGGSQPTKHCLGCSYVLDGLPQPRCPECGRPFDPDDPATFRHPGQVRNRPAVVVSLYLLSLVSTVAYWVFWQGGGMPIAYRLAAAGEQACGLVGCVVVGADPPVDLPTVVRGPLVAGVLWCGWLALVCLTRLRHLPYGVHLLLGFLWCFSGCVPMSIYV